MKNRLSNFFDRYSIPPDKEGDEDHLFGLVQEYIDPTGVNSDSDRLADMLMFLGSNDKEGD